MSFDKRPYWHPFFEYLIRDSGFDRFDVYTEKDGREIRFDLYQIFELNHGQFVLENDDYTATPRNVIYAVLEEGLLPFSGEKARQSLFRVPFAPDERVSCHWLRSNKTMRIRYQDLVERFAFFWTLNEFVVFRPDYSQLLYVSHEGEAVLLQVKYKTAAS